MLRDVLKLIITGLEHSGTSVALDAFKCVKDLDSGYECGILSSQGGIKNYMNYKQGGFSYSESLQRHWQIRPDNLKSVVNNSSTYEDFYKGLRRYSGCIKNKNVGLIDKTPIYIRSLHRIIEKTEDVPIIIMRKDPKNHFCSMVRRCGHWYGLGTFIRNYRFCYGQRHASFMGVSENLPSVHQLAQSTSRIHMIQFEDFVVNPTPIIEKVCEMTQIKYRKEDYLDFLLKIHAHEAETYKRELVTHENHPDGSGKRFKITPHVINQINKELSDFVVI